MTRKFLTKPKVTDGERRDRFVAMTQQTGALDDVKNFEKAFQKAFKSAFENVPARVQTANSSSSAFASFRSRVGSGYLHDDRTARRLLMSATPAAALP